MPKFKSPILRDDYENESSVYDLAPEVFLEESGPVVPIIIKARKNLTDKSTGSNETNQVAVETKALIDTGAKVSCIDSRYAEHLQLPVGDAIELSTATNASYASDMYSDAIIEIKHSDGITFDPPYGLAAANLESFGVSVILGRDFLATGDLLYKGRQGGFIISTD